MKKVKVVKEACIGCGSCSAICPAVFEMGDDGFAQVKEKIDFEKETINNDKITEETKKDIMDAMDGCPTGAIEMYE